jgi:hypothetical protein
MLDLIKEMKAMPTLLWNQRRVLVGHGCRKPDVVAAFVSNAEQINRQMSILESATLSAP